MGSDMDLTWLAAISGLPSTAAVEEDPFSSPTPAARAIRGNQRRHLDACDDRGEVRPPETMLHPGS